VQCADLDRDGRDEIVLVQKSYPFYPAVVRILDGEGRTRTRLWHPGHLLNTFVADGDGDGRPDLYAAGTCNFIADDPGNESAPVVLRVEADWASPPEEISMFAPDRRLAASVPPGVELVYADLGLLRVDGYSDPWGQAYLKSLSSAVAPPRLFVASNRVRFVPNSRGPETDGDLRSFVFVGPLRLETAVWNGIALASLGHGPSDPELAGQLAVRYWNGVSFDTVWTNVPQH
jgi:hypothetical protein